jgi:hypothetical protein
MLSSRGRWVIYNLAIVTAIFAIYGGLVDHPFHTFDDPDYVTSNYYVQNGLTFEGFAWAFRNLDVANWHPLTWLSHMLDIQVFGPKPAGHYLTNILWHIAESLLLFRLVYRIGRSDGMAFAVALIWAVHPANVECVAWIAERKTLIASTMMLAGMISYHCYSQGGNRQYYLLSIVAQILASMAKPIAVLFPVGLVLMDSFGFVQDSLSPQVGVRRPWRAALSEARRSLWINLKGKIPFIAIGGYLAILTFIAQDRVGATAYTYRSELLWRCGNALESLFDYTVKSFSMPESSLLYLLRPLDGLRVFLGALLVVLMVLGGIACFRGRRIVTIGLAWYLLMFLPTIGLVQVGSQRLADRYLGWPLIGLILVVCYGVAKLSGWNDVRGTQLPIDGGVSGMGDLPAVASGEGGVFPMSDGLTQTHGQDARATADTQMLPTIRRCARSRVLPAIALGAWALGLGWQTRALCVDWEDDLRLSRNAMRVGGDSPAMLTNCAVVEVQRNDLHTARRYLAALGDRESVALNLAIIDLIEKKYEAAIAEARRLSKDKKNRITAAAIAGQAFDRLNRPSEAGRAYRTAIEWLPSERSYKLGVEQLRIILPALAAAAAAREEDLIAGAEPDIRWRTKGRMELSR